MVGTVTVIGDAEATDPMQFLVKPGVLGPLHGRVTLIYLLKAIVGKQVW